jgi:hypothetical protein
MKQIKITKQQYLRIRSELPTKHVSCPARESTGVVSQYTRTKSYIRPTSL